MTAATAIRLQKVQKYSASLRRLFQLMLFVGSFFWLVMTIVTIMALSDAKTHFGQVQIANTVYSYGSMSGLIRAIAYVYQSLQVAIALKVTFHLATLFGLYATGKIFSAENVRQIRQVGITLMLIPALWVVGLFVPLLIPAEGISSDGPPVFVQFMGSLQSLIIGLIVIIVSWIMDVGRELREEQDLLV